MGKLKQGGFVSSQEEETAKFISSREDSLERLSEHGIQFEDTSTPSPDDVVIKDDLFFLLNQALSKLSEEEMHLIRELFYYEKTEREVCEGRFCPGCGTWPWPPHSPAGPAFPPGT